jgi:hypothetical protein
MYLECRCGVCSHRGRMRSVALGEWGEVVRALVMACSMARRMHSWLYYGFATLMLCQVCGAMLSLEESTTFFRNTASGRCGSRVIS